jgi:cytochrome c oxidase subunit IV
VNGAQPGRQRRAGRRFWGVFTLLLSILLAATYFMPALDCVGDVRVNPSVESRHFLKDEVRSFSAPLDLRRASVRWLSNYSIYAAPYLFGLLVAVGAATRLVQHRGAQRLCAWVTFLFFVFTAAGVIYCALIGHSMWNGEVIFSLSGHYIIRCLFIPLGATAYACWAIRLHERALLCLAFMGTCICILWWWYWSSLHSWSGSFGGPEPVYGLDVAQFASVLLLISVVGEVSCLTRRNPAHALGQLLLGRVRPYVRDDGCCPACGYCLFGVTEQRCPECGRSFRPEEVGMSLSDLRDAAGKKGSSRD